MARIKWDTAKLNRLLIIELEKAGLEAIIDYKKHERAQNQADYPFAEEPGTRRSGVMRLVDGVRVFAMSPGAWFEEQGNDSSAEIKPKHGPFLRLPLRHENGSGLRHPERARIEIINGRPYLMLRKVRSYSGRHYLENAVKRAMRIRV